MNSSAVEPVDVVEGVPFDMFDVAPRSLAMNQFSLIESVEGLSKGVVIALTLGSN